jgi:hypothetical protein
MIAVLKLNPATKGFGIVWLISSVALVTETPIS